MEITKEKYNLTVVMPYYRTNDTYYLVTAVCDDMTPMTKVKCFLVIAVYGDITLMSEKKSNPVKLKID